MYKTITNTFIVLFTALSLNASVFTLKNGDRVSGNIVASDDTSVTVVTSFGQIVLPKDQIAPEAAPEAAPAVAEATVQTPETPKEKTWQEEYVDAVNPYTYDWKMKIRGGIDYRKTVSESMTYSLAFEAVRNWGELNTITLSGFYDYTRETPMVGPEYVSMDRFGGGALYRRDLNTETGWFLFNNLNYSRDMVKNIKDQVNEIIGVGYTLKFLDDTFVMNLSGGPGVKYINAEGFDHKWVIMATAGEDITWKFHEWMRLEQRMNVEFNVTHMSQYTFGFMLGFIVSPTPVFDVAARYIYQYDGINAEGALRSDTRFMLTIEVPLGW